MNDFEMKLSAFTSMDSDMEALRAKFDMARALRLHDELITSLEDISMMLENRMINEDNAAVLRCVQEDLCKALVHMINLRIRF